MCSCGNSTSCSCHGETIVAVPNETCTAPACQTAVVVINNCKECGENANKIIANALSQRGILFTKNNLGLYILKHRPPISSAGNLVTYDGIHYYVKSQICEGRPPGGQDDITNIPVYSWNSPCFRDRCIYNNSTCNKGSSSQSLDLTTIVNTIPSLNFTDTDCSGASINDLLGGYPKAPLGTCPTAFIGTIFQNKKIFINDQDFICVPLDCGAIDCSIYEDCVL